MKATVFVSAIALIARLSAGDDYSDDVGGGDDYGGDDYGGDDYGGGCASRAL